MVTALDGHEITGNNLSSGHQVCPTWYVQRELNHTVSCECISEWGLVLCWENHALLLTGYCMTYTNLSNSSQTVIGSCPFNSHQANVLQTYLEVPHNLSQLNHFMCGGINRKGLLCSECEDNMAPAVLSYGRQCVQCLKRSIGWLAYASAAFIPPTIFFVLVVMFHIQATSAPMNAFVFQCQLICSIMNQDPWQYIHSTNGGKAALYLIVSIYGIWNLDFFRYILPPFCISNELTTLQTVALEYCIAIYPLLLIVGTYLLTELHDRGCKILRFLSRPFHRFFRRCDPRSSLIHAFATFLLLSYSKLVAVSCNLLARTDVYNNTGSRVDITGLVYYNATVPYLSSAHRPYVILAIFVLSVLVGLPLMILLLYPMKPFRKCLNCCRLRWQPLHTFVDAFQGCYKNGTNGTCDGRYFAGVYLICRILYLITYTFISTHFWLVVILLPITISLSFALVRPYRKNHYNIIDSLSFALLSLAAFWIMYSQRIGHVNLQLVYAVMTVPFVYICVYVAYRLLFRGRNLNFSTLRRWLSKHRNRNDEEIPDRLAHPESYSTSVQNESIAAENDSLLASMHNRPTYGI